MNKETFPIWKPSPNRTSIGLSQNTFPTTVLPKDDRTNSFQEERLGLPYWTMILAICVVVDESKCLDTPILEFSVIWVHPPFLPGYKQILHQLLVRRNQAIWKWYPWLWLLSFEMVMILVQWILRETLNRLLQYHLRKTTRPLYFWCFASNSEFFKWNMSINDAKWTVAPFVAVMNSHLFLQYGLRDYVVQNSPYAFWWIHWLPEYTQVLSCFCQIRHSHNSS